jgi:alpha-glucosidase (family GH31 glycosyl hydrolase)
MRRPAPFDTEAIAVKSCLLRGRLATASLLVFLVYSSVLAQTAQPLTLTVAEGERWWAGVISQSHRMPLHERPYTFDSHGDTAGNQVQPLLISDQGRYIWSEDPFRFEFRVGAIHLSARAGAIQTGQHGSTLKEVYQYVSRRFFPPAGRTPDPLLFTRPQFNTWIELTYNQNQKDILDYARHIVDQGFPPGVLMIDEGWAEDYGNWDFARARFDDPKAMIRKLHEDGFKIMLWVCPYITPDGIVFTNLHLAQVEKGRTAWILNRDKPTLPAVMHWWDGFSAVVDLTNPDGRQWFKGQLDRLVSVYGVDGFKFDGGDAEHYAAGAMLVPAKSHLEVSPNRHSELFAQVGLDYPLNEYRACWKMGGQPIAQRLRDKNHTWEDLRKLVPGILNQGLMGYAFTCPDLIGGGEYLSFRNLDQVDQELVVRAAECHALMPMMQFSVAPWRVLSKENLAICRTMALLHARLGDEILALARDAAQTGEPIVRHLEYEYPHQDFVDVNDQFLLGRNILVAPVLAKGATSRVVRFPPGKWKGDDGTTVEGPATVAVAAPLARLPWYRRTE